MLLSLFLLLYSILFVLCPFILHSCSGGKGPRQCSLGGNIKDAVLSHLLLFLPVLPGVIRCGACTLKMSGSALFVLIPLTEGSQSNLCSSYHLSPHSSFFCPLSCLLSVSVSVTTTGCCYSSTCGTLQGLSGRLDVRVPVCLLLSLRLFPNSAVWRSKSPPSAFGFSVVKRKKMLPSLWCCICITAWEPDTGFAKEFAEALRVIAEDHWIKQFSHNH